MTDKKEETGKKVLVTKYTVTVRHLEDGTQDMHQK